jgi:hypothetical protein
MPTRPCLDCGRPTLRGYRCPDCGRAENTAQHNPVRDGRLRRVARRMLAEHRRTVGPWCPGDGPAHDAHPEYDLTVDHVVPVSAGGAPTDRANLRVLCRSWNSAKGARRVGYHL